MGRRDGRVVARWPGAWSDAWRAGMDEPLEESVGVSRMEAPLGGVV